MVGTAVNVTDDPIQAEFPGALLLIETDGVTTGFTVIVIMALLAKGGEAHKRELVIVHAMMSLFTSVLVIKVLPFAPTLTPFIFHWYAGVPPPFTGVAVNFTLVPEQMVFPAALLIIDTDGTTNEFTVIVMLLLAAAAGEAQLSVLVIIHEMTSLFISALSEYELLFVPTFTPFFFH